MHSFNVAVIAGDGIGKEVIPEGIRYLKPQDGDSIFNSCGVNLTGAARNISKAES